MVLFSITDTWNEKYLTDSTRLEAKKLINTAVSRAKKLLVLVGDADSWLLQAFSAPPGYSRPSAGFYSAIIFPSANAFLHSSGNTVSCRTFFSAGSKRVQGQSVLL